MKKFHINDAGEAKACQARSDESCQFGGSHYDSPEAARAGYEQIREQLEYSRGEFFKQEKKGRFTIIEKDTGYVLSDNLVVAESPDEELDEDDFLDMASSSGIPIQKTGDLNSFSNPLVVELDTGAIASTKSLYAIDSSKQILNYDEILESDGAAADAAEDLGFKLWD